MDCPTMRWRRMRDRTMEAKVSLQRRDESHEVRQLALPCTHIQG